MYRWIEFFGSIRSDIIESRNHLSPVYSGNHYQDTFAECLQTRKDWWCEGLSSVNGMDVIDSPTFIGVEVVRWTKADIEMDPIWKKDGIRFRWIELEITPSYKRKVLQRGNQWCLDLEKCLIDHDATGLNEGELYIIID